MTLAYAALLAVLVLAAVAVLWQRLRALRRQRSLARLLDGADEMERLLHRTRERMEAMHAVIGRVPEDMAAIARASLDSERLVQDGLRDVLEHRLWIRSHSGSARQSELDAACAALDRARLRIAQELDRLDRAGADLAQATAAAHEAAAREPAALRRR